MREYIKTLNNKKPYFTNLEAKIPNAIVEYNEEDEDNESFGMPTNKAVAH